MADSTSGYNIEFPIYGENGQPFNGLVLRKSVVETTIMALDDKISGDILWGGTPLVFTMNEYIIYDGVKYVMVNPPTIVQEGMVANNSDLKGMVKYSFVFYHPMYLLNNFPFTDVATKDDEEYYLSQNKSFSWIGTFFDFKDKINANLRGTRWHVVTSDDEESLAKMAVLSDVLTFDKNTIGDAMKKAYETWDVPYTIKNLPPIPSGYELWEYLHVISLTQVVVGEEAPMWLFLRNLPSVGEQGRIYECKIVDDGTILHHLFPCRKLPDTPSGTYRIGMYDIITNVFFDTAGQGTFEIGGELLRDYDFAIVFGTPTTGIYDTDGNEYLFRMGKGLGLKNNSRTPRNNKIITRISGYGNEDNIPYGYPQIVWTGNQSWDYTINNEGGMQEIEVGGVIRTAMSYPIYDGIVNGENVRLIKHPFTRTHLMPTIYHDTVDRKVNPRNPNYDPDIRLVDFYDADNTYPNPIVLEAPSYEIREYDVKPQLGDDRTILDAEPTSVSYITLGHFAAFINTQIQSSDIVEERSVLVQILSYAISGVVISRSGTPIHDYYYKYSLVANGNRMTISYVTLGGDVDPFTYIVDYDAKEDYETDTWDDTMDGNGEIIQSTFNITLPALGFDIYACAAITQEMTIAMRSGACIGCSFPVQVDWEDYKRNFYNDEGKFDPEPHTQEGDGHVRDVTKYPDSTSSPITIIVAKDNNTFGTLMPNIYQQPKTGDHFTILGISLPVSYITTTEGKLETMMKEDMRLNNVFYYDYPLTFDEHFLSENVEILEQITTNTIIRFSFQGEELSLYVKQITKKFGHAPLPQYDITLTDNIEVVLNAIGSVQMELGRIREQQIANEQRFDTAIATHYESVPWQSITDAPSYVPSTDTMSLTTLEAISISINGQNVDTIFHPYGGSGDVPFRASQVTSMGGVTAYAATTDDTETILDILPIDPTLRKTNDVLGLERGQNGQILQMSGGLPTWVDTILRFMGENQDGSVRFDTDVNIGDESDTFDLRVSGTVTAAGFINTSDKRKKKPIKDIELSLDDILSLSLVLFTYKGDKNKTQHVGTYAQEVKKILPQAVITLKDGTLALDYSILGTALSISLAREVAKLRDMIKDTKDDGEPTDTTDK